MSLSLNLRFSLMESGVTHLQAVLEVADKAVFLADGLLHPLLQFVELICLPLPLVCQNALVFFCRVEERFHRSRFLSLPLEEHAFLKVATALLVAVFLTKLDLERL